MDVYGDNVNIIAEEVPQELSFYMEDVLPEKKHSDKDNIFETSLNETMINMDEFLQN